MAMPDDIRLRSMLTTLNAGSRLVEDFTRASDTGKHQLLDSMVEGWLLSMRQAGYVSRHRRVWVITSAGQAKLAEIEGRTYVGRICGASSKDTLQGYGAYMARSEGRPGANDYRRHARVGF